MLTPEEIAGVYRQVGAELVTADGTSTSAGDTRNSQLMYSADGYMAIVSTPPDRPKVSGSSPVDLNKVPIEELPGAVKDMVVYAGRFELKDGIIEHLVDQALNPNLVGGAVVRRIDYDGTDLTLASPPADDGSYRRIRWRRVAACQ